MTPEQRVEGVRALFAPRNIAIVGASDRPGNWSGRVYRALRKFSFPGKIYPVNPRNQTVWDGQTCYPSLAALPEPPDHVVVIVPGAAAIETIVEAGKAKARSATVFSGGFGEGGDPKGRELGVALKRAIEEAGIAVSGPNCMGNLAAPNRLMTIPDDRITELERGPCAMCHNITGTLAGGQSAPDLTHLGSRSTIAAGSLPNTRGYLAGWIADPQHVKPGNRMPAPGLNDEQLQSVLAYLESLK